MTPPPNGFLLRNIMMAADFLQNHLRHFYVLCLPDYVEGPDFPPFTPKPRDVGRMPKAINDKLMDHYWEALDMSMRSHQLMGLFSSKAPHQQTLYAGGLSVPLNSEKILRAKSLLKDIKTFIDNNHAEDMATVAKYYDDYFELGQTSGNFISFGSFAQAQTKDRRGEDFLAKRGVRINGEDKELDFEKIREHLDYSWYEQDDIPRHPSEGVTKPNQDKDKAYTWIKAPRYEGHALECGSLPRRWLQGKYTKGVSTMDRLIARSDELVEIAGKLETWLEELHPEAPIITKYEPKKEGKGFGTVEAMRGALGHWIEIENGVIANYQVVTPSAWLFSPRDNQGQMGPVDYALTGLPIEDPEELTEIGRVIRSFDPCLSCAVHLIEAGHVSKTKIIG